MKTERFSKKELSRIDNSKRNATTALVTAVLMGVFSFIERIVFNRVFISDYLGLYSFFSNVISILNTAEMGITTSIAFALYAPLEYNDEEQIVAIMRFYRNTYRIIGSIILAGGLILMPFLHMMISVEVPMEQVYVYYVIFLSSSVLNYFLIYRAVVFSANQQRYKYTLVSNGVWSILYVAQAIISLTTRSFFYYCLAMMAANIVKDMMLRTMATKQYPMIKSKMKATMDPKIKDRIIKNTKGLVATKFGNILVNATDSVLISAMVGTAILGKYANYQMLVTGLLSVVYILPEAATASIGNANVTESKRSFSHGFWTMELGSFLVYAPLTIAIVNLINPIVSIFFGSDKLLSLPVVAIIALNFYIKGFREILIAYKTSMGLYWEDRKRPIIEGATNLVTSVILGRFFGIWGILAGTAITNFTVNVVREPQLIFHEGLERSAFWYYVVIILRFAFVVLISCLTLFLNSLVPYDGIGGLAIKCVITLLVTAVSFVIVFRRNEHFKSIVETLKVALKSKISRQSERSEKYRESRADEDFRKSSL